MNNNNNKNNDKKIYLALDQAYEDILELHAFTTLENAKSWAWKRSEANLKHRIANYYPNEKTTVEEEYNKTWQFFEVELLDDISNISMGFDKGYKRIE